MRTITIGRSSAAQISLSSQFVSQNHAEIVQLASGEMYIIDKNSSNGTFIEGNAIQPEKYVAIRRGVNIRFADTPLNWSLIPDYKLPDAADVKSITTIGSFDQNSIVVNSPQVSRFHATIKEMKDGKWYISDHSTNGTTLNGGRVPKNQFVQIKKGDVIKCADVQIQNPAKKGKSIWPAVLGAIVGVAAVAAALIMLLPKIGGGDDNIGTRIYKKYSPSTAQIYINFHYKVTAGDLEPERLVLDDENNPLNFDGTNTNSLSATGFFISEDGMFATNLHIAKPWLFDDKERELRGFFLKYFNFYYPSAHISWSDIKIEGVLDDIYIIPNGQYFDETNAIKCKNIASTDNPDIDIALFQTLNDRLPEGASYVSLNTVSANPVPVGTHIYTMGFPMSDKLQDLGNSESPAKTVLQAVSAEGEITQNGDKYNYTCNVALTHGASGSPVFDGKGNLVAIVSSGYSVSAYNYCVKARYIKELVDAYFNSL